MKRFLELGSLVAAGALGACADDLTSPTTIARDARYNLSAQVAANIVVTTDDDAGNGATTCTLREAILAATSNAAVGACSAGNGAAPDVIGFDEALDGASITLAGARLEIASDIVIDADGKHITISGNGASQVFYVGAGTEVVLRGLTITGGNDTGTKLAENGGGIVVHETSHAGDSTRLTLEASTVTGNHGVGLGGGIKAGFRTILTVRRSTISGNTALQSGGGIYTLSRVVIANTTIAANTAKVTGGIDSDPSFGFGTITNSIISGNSATDTFDPQPDCGVAFTSGGHNVFGVDAECPITSDDIGIAAADVFSMVLDQNLADNGGPTVTHALLDPAVTSSANPAVDFGGTCGPTDQRGHAAPAGAACDAGAVELGANTPTPAGDLVVNAADDIDDGVCDISHCSLREAIAAAGAGDEITFDLDLPATITLDGSELSIDNEVTITGPGAGMLAVSGVGGTRVLTIGSSGNVHISGLTIRDGSAQNGGGIFTVGMLTIESCIISDNHADLDGGGIFNGGQLTIRETTIRSNTAGEDGGGIHSGAGSLTVGRTTISTNGAGRRGGGIVAINATVSSSTMSENRAGIEGGAVKADGGWSITNSTIAGNYAEDHGGGIAVSVADVAVASTILAGNSTAAGAGDCDLVQDPWGQVISGGHNLIGESSASLRCVLGGTGDMTIDPTTVFTTVLGTFDAHGGPTSTYALLDPGTTGSLNPAIDQGNCAVDPTTDQRGDGFPRVIEVPAIDNAEGSNGCDIGAFEFMPSNNAPIADAGLDRTVECEADGCAEVTLDGSGSSDPDGDAFGYIWTDGDGNSVGNVANPTVKLEVGKHSFSLVVNDGSVDSPLDQVTITVEDATAPALAVGAGSAVLWAPNHKYHTIRLRNLGLTASDACDATLSGNDAVITRVTSDEPEDVAGDADGITNDDIVIGDCRTVRLRAQRDESGNGRVYTLHLAVTDASGNVGTATYKVAVPPVKSGTAVDDGEAEGYTVTQAASCTAST